MATRPVSKAALDHAEALFVEAFGRAMLNWSHVEQRLFWYFEHITEMKHEMSRAVYYSARNFTARAEMLAAAMSANQALDSDLSVFLQKALKKARQYQAFRNSLAHGETIMFANTGIRAENRLTLVEGKRALHLSIDSGIKVSQLRTAAKNFSRLASLLTVVYLNQMTKGAHGKSPAQCLKQVLRLPNTASSRTPAPIPKERKPRRRSSGK
ncbi:hypothetical protein [Bauldia litoralis]|uniref:Uncharacterized protein n=1 Tax=Bauldia litoralis TaxID=665467 RepID=A0A1G6CEZ1_9HYPH|nr:hypothetical protein [Bauldia litoralis]SDB31385.1 hypothetical protein SAMN02982931_02397 [Bauldia litoralis]